jgi:hypothetical protein
MDLMADCSIVSLEVRVGAELAEVAGGVGGVNGSGEASCSL